MLALESLHSNSCPEMDIPVPGSQLWLVVSQTQHFMFGNKINVSFFHGKLEK